MLQLEVKEDLPEDNCDSESELSVGGGSDAENPFLDLSTIVEENQHPSVDASSSTTDDPTPPPPQTQPTGPPVSAGSRSDLNSKYIRLSRTRWWIDYYCNYLNSKYTTIKLLHT